MLRILALAAALLGAAPALAQTQPAVLQPETAVVSPGGVDMNTGQYRFQGTDLSIGSEGNGGINVTRVKQSGKPFTTNWHIFLNRDCDRAPGSSLQTPCTINWKLESMAVTKTWLQYHTGLMVEQGIPSPGMTSLQHTGLRWQFTMADGTLLAFESGSSGSGDVWATSMTRKDGTIYTFAYDSGGDPADGDKRLRRVTSNTGYEAIFEYEGNGTDAIAKACVYNTSVVTPPSSNVCPAGVQTVTYGTGLSSITDVMAKVWTIDRQSSVHSYYKPGYPSTPYMVNNLGSTPGGGFWEPARVVLSQQLPDGRTIAYDYANLLIYESDGPQNDLKSGRGMGWTVNGSQTTQVGWAVTQGNMGGQPGALYISPAPNLVVDPLGRVSGATYEGGTYPFGNALSKTLIGGRKETYAYEGYANLSSRTWVPSTTANGETPITTSYTYNCSVSFNCAKPASITDPKNNVTNYTYDATNGLLLTETMPADANGVRPQKRYTWVPQTARYKTSSGAFVNGASVWVINSISECRTSASCAGTADETLTTFAYPAFGTANNILPISKTVRAGDSSLIATTTFTYDATGNKLTEDGPLANTSTVIDISRWQYDAKRRVTASMTPDPDGPGGNVPLAVKNTYDDAGRLIKVENGKLSDQATDWSNFTLIDSVETDYDVLDRKLQERKKDNLGTIQALTQYSYDSFGRLDCTAVRMNQAAYGSLPVSACSQSTGAGQSGVPWDRITRNTYDLGDQLLSVTEAVGTPDQAVEASYAYSPSGKRQYMTDARGFKAELGYDGHDRQSHWFFPNKTSPGIINWGDYEYYTYDNNGNRLTLRKRDGSVLSFAYDNLNRMTVKTVPERTNLSGITPSATRDVYMAYDLQGHQTGARFDSASGEGLVSNYDALGRLTSTTLTMDGIGRTLTYGHDIRGFRTSLTHPDTTVFAYDPDTLGRFKTLSQGTTVLRGFTYDGNGRLTASALGNGAPGSTTLGYDTIGRLNVLSHNLVGTAASVSFGFTHSPASQTLTQSRNNDSYAWTGAVPATRTYTTNGLNQYTQVASTNTIPLAYDDNGNLTNSSDTSGSWAYLYDVENRLVKATYTPTGGTAVGTNLRYDPMGRLYEVTGTSTTRFLYDGDELIGEYAPNGVMLRRYVHGIAVDDPVIDYVGSSLTDPRHMLADRQGSIILLTDKNGWTVAKNTYDEYGIPKSDQGIPVAGRFAYTGQIWLPEIGMYYYKARLYSPTLGRFLQTDPIGYKDQINLYAYVANDPVNFADPTGTKCSGSVEDDNLSCKLDDPGELTKREQDHVNSQYTSAVKHALTNPDEEVTLGAYVNGEEISETTTAGEIGQRLYDAHVSFSEVLSVENESGQLVEDGDVRATNTGGRISISRFGIENRTTNALRTEALVATFLHEGGHDTVAGATLDQRTPARGVGDHNVPFRNGINDFLSRTGKTPVRY